MYCPNPECPDFVETGEPGEYNEGVTKCAKCGAWLVPYLPPELLAEKTTKEAPWADDRRPDEDLVVAASFARTQDAHLAMSFLQANGIEVVELHTGPRGKYSDLAFGPGLRLLVRASQLDDARALLADAEKQP